jgi:CheY-like chemotaxis protein
MSGLQDFLAPFSHLLFANRDKAIVVLGILLGWVTIQLLIARWRTERLQRDLASAKSGPSTSSRRYSPSAQVEESAPDSGPLPPVKGGRSYARNLGSALSKAGMSGQQIYSPPTPQGWGPSPGPGQPAMGQPPQGAPYSPPTAPWGAPAPQQPSPWGYPAAPGRPAPAPSSAPFYQSPATLPPQQPTPMPMTPPASAPGFFGPSSPPAPSFTPPAFAPATSGPAAAVPPMTPPSAPPGPPMMPMFGNPPGSPAPEPAATDPGRRGKPKRRRFNFNVLENLEKMVQTRSEPLPPTGWQPPAAPPTAAPAPTVPPIPATPAFNASAPPVPAVEAVSPGAEAPEAPSLPLPFGSNLEEAPATEPEQTVTRAEEPPLAHEVEEPSIASKAEEPPAVEEETPPMPPARKSMREMLFGEEMPPTAKPEPAPEPPPSEPEPVASESTWQPSRWTRAEEPVTTPEPETTTAEPAAEEPVVEPEPEAAPAVEASQPEPFAPWRSSFASESTFEPEPAKAETEDAAAASVPETPAADSGGGSHAGSLVIIEDDEAAATYYATLFRGNGYHVEVANDGVSGVDLCARVQPQVILLDVMMPRQNGILVLQTLRASDETKNTPVVVMSNFSEPTLIKRAIQLGALEYVIKTQVEGTALLNAVPRWINREKAFAAA